MSANTSGTARACSSSIPSTQNGIDLLRSAAAVVSRNGCAAERDGYCAHTRVVPGRHHARAYAHHPAVLAQRRTCASSPAPVPAAPTSISTQPPHGVEVTAPPGAPAIAAAEMTIVDL